MAGYRAAQPILISTRVITASRMHWHSFSRKYTPYVVFLSPTSSGYHTKARKRCTLQFENNLTQFSTRPAHRSNSYFTSILQKAFVVKAAEPLPDADVTDTAAYVSGPVLEGTSEVSVTSEATLDDKDVHGLADSFSLEMTSGATLDNTDISNPVSGSVLEAAPESTLTSTLDSITYIPPPPAPPEDLVESLNALGEATLQSVGLGGWTPVGMIQNALEFLHVTFNLPWWGTICIATVCIRIMMFPLVIQSQKQHARMSSILPQMQFLQMKITEARNTGNQIEVARLTQELALLMQKKDVNPLKTVLPPLAQSPIFISMFLGLRGMASLPLESMKTGGMLWFVDLTSSDPLYLLPLVTACSLFATIELGIDGPAFRSNNVKWVLRAIPLFLFPFAINFPCSVLCYWVSTNVFSLVQVYALKIPSVRQYFNIPETVHHSPDILPKQKGMVEGFKDSWSNMKVYKELQERERYDEMRFKKAGTGPVVRTFKFDPTKKPITVRAKEKCN